MNSNGAKKKCKGSVVSHDVVIGQNLKKIRTLRNKSQVAVANDLGITFQQIQKYEKGLNRISASMLYDVSKILEVDITEFFSGLDPGGEQNKLLSNADQKTLKAMQLFDKISNEKIKKDLLKVIRSMSEE